MKISVLTIAIACLQFTANAEGGPNAGTLVRGHGQGTAALISEDIREVVRIAIKRAQGAAERDALLQCASDVEKVDEFQNKTQMTNYNEVAATMLATVSATFKCL